MNIRFALPIALVLGAAFLPACGKTDDLKKAAESAVELTADNAGAQATSAIAAVTKGLNGITDLEGAKSAATSLLPNLDILSKAKAMLGDKMPSLGGLGDIVTTLKDKFAGKTAILGALKPIFDKIMGMIK